MNSSQSAQRVLILNPNSGSPATTERVRKLASSRDDIVLRETQSEADVARFAREAVEQQVDVLIASGGDGTLHAVANALMAFDHRPTLAVVPTGSANDFAKSIGLSAESVEAFDAIDRGDTRRVDVVRLNDGERYLLNAATGGFSDLIAARLTPERKARWGGLAYAFAALEALPDTPNYRITFDLDGESLCCNACAVIIANGRFAGGALLAPEAQIDDHQLDVILVTAETVAQRTALLASFAIDQHLQSDHLLFKRAKDVSIDADPEMPFICDGERVGTGTTRFEVVPGALNVIAPRG